MGDRLRGDNDIHAASLAIEHHFAVYERVQREIRSLADVLAGMEPIADLTHVLQYDDLVGDARGVLRDLAPVERQVQTRDERWLTVRMRPYRTVEDKIDGVVVTLMPGRR